MILVFTVHMKIFILATSKAQISCHTLFPYSLYKHLQSRSPRTMVWQQEVIKGGIGNSYKSAEPQASTSTEQNPVVLFWVFPFVTMLYSFICM